MKIYSKKVKDYRKKSKLTQEELGQLIGVSRNTMASWEQGKTFPSEEKVKLLAKHLGVTPSDISELENAAFLSPENSALIKAMNWIHGLGGIFETQKTDMLLSLLDSTKDEIRHASVIFNAFMSCTNSISYIKDRELKYIYANPGFMAEIGKEISVTGKKDINFFPYEDAVFNEKEDAQVIETETGFKYRERYFLKSSTKKYCLVSKRPIKDQSGKVIGLYGEFIDITPRYRNEYLRLDLQTILNQLDLCVWVGKGIGYDIKGYLYSKKIILKVGGAIRKIFETNMSNEILDSHDLKKYNEFRKLIPEHAKRMLTEKFTAGIYPIIRNFDIQSPFTKKIYSVTEYIYYFKESDILCGLTFILPNKQSM